MAALVTPRIVTPIKNWASLVLESCRMLPAPGGLTDNFLHRVPGTVMACFRHESCSTDVIPADPGL